MAKLSLKKRKSLRLGDLIFYNGVPTDVPDEEDFNYLISAYPDSFDIIDEGRIEIELKKKNIEEQQQGIPEKSNQHLDGKEPDGSLEDAIASLDAAFGDDLENDEISEGVELTPDKIEEADEIEEIEVMSLEDHLKSMKKVVDIKAYASDTFNIVVPGSVRSREDIIAYIVKAAGNTDNEV